MTCEIKSGHHPVQIKCSFPEVNEAKRDFSVYYHSSDESQNAVVNCIFNGKNKCLAEEGFEATLEGLNAATITVPDSFATKTGMFVCQKGDLPFSKNCQFPLVENFPAGNIVKSEIDYGTTANVPPTFVTPEHSGNEDDSQWIIIYAVVSSIVGVILLILCIITIIWFKRCKTKQRHERANKSEIYRNKEFQPSKVDEECKIILRGNQSKCNELVQGGLNAELTRILGSNTATNSQVLGNGFDCNEIQEIADEECPHLDWKNIEVSPTRPSSECSRFSKISEVPLIPH